MNQKYKCTETGRIQTESQWINEYGDYLEFDNSPTKEEVFARSETLFNQDILCGVFVLIL